MKPFRTVRYTLEIDENSWTIDVFVTDENGNPENEEDMDFLRKTVVEVCENKSYSPEDFCIKYKNVFMFLSKKQ